jgi:hypothetical protein
VTHDPFRVIELLDCTPPFAGCWAPMSRRVILELIRHDPAKRCLRKFPIRIPRDVFAKRSASYEFGGIPGPARTLECQCGLRVAAVCMFFVVEHWLHLGAWVALCPACSQVYWSDLP